MTRQELQEQARELLGDVLSLQYELENLPSSPAFDEDYKLEQYPDLSELEQVSRPLQEALEILKRAMWRSPT